MNLCVTDANGHTTSFQYDAFGRVTQTTFPSNLSENYQYDADNNLTSKTDRKGQTIQYVYDALNRLTQKTYPDSTSAEYTYDLVGKVLQVEFSAQKPRIAARMLFWQVETRQSEQQKQIPATAGGPHRRPKKRGWVPFDRAQGRRDDTCMRRSRSHITCLWVFAEPIGARHWPKVGMTGSAGKRGRASGQGSLNEA